MGKREKATVLRDQGLTYLQIGKQLDISKTLAYYFVNPDRAAVYLKRYRGSHPGYNDASSKRYRDSRPGWESYRAKRYRERLKEVVDNEAV